MDVKASGANQVQDVSSVVGGKVYMLGKVKAV